VLRIYLLSIRSTHCVPSVPVADSPPCTAGTVPARIAAHAHHTPWLASVNTAGCWQGHASKPTPGRTRTVGCARESFSTPTANARPATAAPSNDYDH
jgi:hypothetical protein